MSMDFEDYIVNYPLPDDHDIQNKISNREEFHELRAIKGEEQRPGTFFKHQRIFARYMRYYDRVFNIHETGTGKTGSIIATAEMFRQHGLGIQKVVILFPGRFTLQDFQTQLVKFVPSYGDKDEKVRNKKIKKWYELNTYKSFASYIQDRTLEELKSEYSHSLFFLDEVHNLRNYTQTQDKDTYESIWSLLHLAEHTKIALGSATPMVNAVNDFVPLINLILPADQQLSLSSDFSRVSPDALDRLLRGKVSFVRSSGNKIQITEMGTSLKTKVRVSVSKSPNVRFVTRRFTEGLKLEPEEQDADEPEDEGQQETRTFLSDTRVTLMEPQGLQKEVCRRIFKETKDEFSLKQKSASTFVFPDGSIGSQGYDQYMTPDKQFRSIPGKEDLNSLLARPELSYQEKLDRLRDMSAKFHFYISNEMGNTGNSFCYIEDVRGGGMYVLARILDQFGFQHFDNISVMTDDGQVDPNFPKRERYAFLTSDTETENTLKLFNSKQNKNGEYIRLMIASKAARDGINLSNVLRGYMISPLWNDAAMYQAISRFIRATSHEDLIQDLRDGEKLQVEVYRLAVYVPPDTGSILEEQGEIGNYTDKELMTISNDLYTYRLSDKKDVLTRTKLEEMKKSAFDFILNYNRNYTDSAVSGTKQAGYGPRKPTPSRPFIRNLVSNTKRLLYHDDELDMLETRARELLLRDEVVPLDMLRTMGLDDIFISIFVNERVPVLRIDDGFGLSRKVVYKNDCLQVQLDNHYMSIEPRQLEITDAPIEVSASDLDVFERQVLASDDMESTIRAKLEDKFPDDANQLMVQRLLERVAIKIRDGDQDLKLNQLYGMFEPYVHVVSYPHKATELATELFQGSSRGPGRAAQKFSFSKIKDRLDDLSKKETNDDVTYYHFFKPVTSKPSVSSIFSTVFKITDKKRMVRILRRDKNEFEDASEIELPILQLYYIEYLKQWMANYITRSERDLNAIGSVFRDGKFRILTPEKAASKQGMYTGGQGCESFDTSIVISNPEFYINAVNMDFSRTPVFDLHQELTVAPKSEMETYLRQINVPLTDNVEEQYFRTKLSDKNKTLQCKYLIAYFELKDYLIRTL